MDSWRLRDHARYGRDFILDILFPISCLGCSKPDVWLCPKCFRSLPISSRHSCPQCGQANKNSTYCSKCSNNFYLNGIWVASDYNNPLLANTIKKFKYNFIKDLRRPLALLLALYLRQILNQFRLTNQNLTGGKIWKKFSRLDSCPKLILNFSETLVINVPLHKKRFQWRGFNQAKLLTDSLSQRFFLGQNSDNLIRKKHTKAQAKLNKQERQSNVLDSFAWTGHNLDGRHILLIDDVASTGSTLNECAKALKKNNAGEVWGLVVARG